jgi:hypothetical protein
MTDDYSTLEKRITELESKLNEKPKKPRAPRKPSEYNTFLADYLTKNKSDKKPHKELFGEAVKAWNAKKR